MAGSLALGAWLSLHAWQDPRAAIGQAGDATIHGTVLTDDTPGRPLRRAVVTISGDGLPLSRSVITDDEGGFSIGGVAAGRVVVNAAKPGYLPGSYGASRAGRPGTPLVLAAGETREIAISLVRGGVLAGTIRDDRGAPAAGLQVFAIDALRPVAPEPRPGRTGSRIDNRGVVTDDQVPSGADVADAVLTLVNRRTALSGTLQTPSGLSAHEYFVVVFPADPAGRLGGSRRVKFTRPASDGSFSFTDLPPGDYRLVALTDIEPDAWESAEFLEALADQGVPVRVDETTGAHQDLRVLAP